MGHISNEEIEKRFSYHAADSFTRSLHDKWRDHEKWMAEAINNLPGQNSRESSIAFTKLEEMAMMVHAHIARNVTAEPIPNTEREAQ